MSAVVRSTASRWLGWLVVAHVVWGAVRLPMRVWQRRVEDVVSYRENGAAHFFLVHHGAGRTDGAAAVQWLLEHTDRRCVLAWTGADRGAFELASGLLAPRLLVPVAQLPADGSEHLGRPVASDGGRRLVLVGHGDTVEVERR